MSSLADPEVSVTTRELEILELVAFGYSAKEIAARLGIAPRTVEGHIDIIRFKFRARNRAHMVTKAVLGGQLSLGQPASGQRLCAECLFKPDGAVEPEFEGFELARHLR
jgi:DNA-binding CsgD family transcriptional regulator